MLTVFKDLYLHKKMVESSRGLFYEQLLSALVFRGIPDNEKVNDCVPCIRRQRFTGSLHKKAKVYQDRKSSQANFLPFGVTKPKLSCSDHVQTYVHRNTPRRTSLQV